MDKDDIKIRVMELCKVEPSFKSLLILYVQESGLEIDDIFDNFLEEFLYMAVNILLEEKSILLELLSTTNINSNRTINIPKQIPVFNIIRDTIATTHKNNIHKLKREVKASAVNIQKQAEHKNKTLNKFKSTIINQIKTKR